VSEQLPEIEERPKRLVWINGLKEDRHTDQLMFVPPEEEDFFMELNEERARRIHAQLGEIISKWDAQS
jgi:hypothetical protein